MDERNELEALRQDNQRMSEACREIEKKLREIDEILDSVKDLIEVNEPERHTPVTEDEVKSLLKKYSRIS